MTDYSFFAQNGTVSVATDTSSASPTYTAVMAVQNCSFELQFEANDLYSWGTVKRVATARHEAKVNVTLEYAKILDEDFFKYILNPSAGSTALATGVSIADTTNQHMFNVKAEIPDTTGTKKMVIEATDVYFSNLPFSGDLGEWVKMNLEGHGADLKVSIVSITPPTPGNNEEEGP